MPRSKEQDSRPKPTKPPLLSLLVSYAYLRKEKYNLEIIKEAKGKAEFLLDSGAFTALNAGQEIALDDYMDFLDRNGDLFFRYVALDKIGDPKQSAKNLKVMVDRGLKPVPVHVLGDTERRLDELFDVSDYVCLAGFRRPHRGGAPPNYVKVKMEWAKGRPVHWLGLTRQDLIATFKPFSVDCSSWMAGGMYGRMQVYIGNGLWRVLDKDKLFQQVDAPIRRTLARFGIPVDNVFDDLHWHNKAIPSQGLQCWDAALIRVVGMSWIDYAFDIRERYGTRIFLACQSWQVNALMEYSVRIQEIRAKERAAA
jgi:hypothetical protein